MANSKALPLVGSMLLAAAAFAVYGRALNAPFIFDDRESVANNPSIVGLWPLVGDAENPGPLSPPRDLPTAGRPLVNLSLALNYQFGQLDPAGYHVFNLFVHILSALLLMAIVGRTLRLPYFGGRFDRVSGLLAFATALLWALHPLQTETVVYITQRTELMVGFFYLATLYAALRYWAANSKNGRTIWLVLATLACLGGMACKEVMVSAPVIVLLFERTFITGSFRRSFQNSWPLYVGLAFGWLLLWGLNCDHPRAVSAGFDLNVPAYVWWLTQTKVLFTYLKLTFWPWPLAIHYEMPYLTTLGDAWLWLVPTVLLAIGIAVLLWRRYSVGFMGAWVFLILSPTLVVPIVTEVAAERRMYLPLAALVTLLVVGIYVLTQQTASRLDPNRKSIARWPAVFVAGFTFVVALVFSLVSFHRLEAYHDEISLWQDNVLRQPDDSVSHNNLGMAFAQAGQLPEAMKEFEETIQLDPKHASAHNNLSYFLNRLGRTQEAIQQAELALRINSKSPDAHNNLGNALAEMGRKQEAIEQYRTALQLKPNYADAHNNLGFALAGLGQLDEAIVQYEEALRLNPNHALARNNLGAIWLNRGQFDRAVVNLQEAVRLQPDNIDARINLGIALARTGHDQAAVDILQGTLRLNPNNARIHNNLGLALSGTDRWQEAADQFQQAIKLQPDYGHAYVNLANACAQLGRSAEAIAAAGKAMGLARAQGQTAMSQQIESWLNSYRAKIKETAK